MPSHPPTAGLTAAEVETRVLAGEVNAVEDVTSRPLAEIVKANIFTRFNALLGTLFVLVLATGRLLDGLFGVAAILNSLFGIAQEWAAKRKLDSLAVLHAPSIQVVRDGLTQQIAVTDVVRGELVALRAGDQVPADGPLVSGEGLEIDESNLTGESDPIAKDDGDLVSSGTVVVAGHGWMTAEVVGAQTAAHRLSAEAKQFTRAFSEVQHSTNVLLRYLTWVVIVCVPVVVLTQWRATGSDLGAWRDVIVRSAAALVGLIPEGLVLLTTLAFVLAAVQLSRRQALVQELPAVEGLARVDVICLDKTGTLTAGDIRFDRVEALQAGIDEEVARTLGALSHVPDANATARALAAAFPDPGWQLTEQIPFSSARKWSAAAFATQGTFVLGAPDVLLPALVAPPARLPGRLEDLAESGDRVLLLTRADRLPEGDRVPDLTAYALVMLTETVRPDAAQTLAFFAAQGVRVLVISGDNPRTVAAVARRVGLDPGVAVDARNLPQDETALAEVVATTTVFGRVTPTQKQTLVRALQAQGHTVAMTGDGVNDVLALKHADIGIAMGNGSSASKAVAQLVLLDGRFANLPTILAEGRRLIANVERVANLFVAKNVMSLVVIVATALVGLVFPFLPRHLTLLSTFAIGIPAAILALGPNARRYTPGFLHRVLALAVPSGIAAGLVSFLAYDPAVSFGQLDQQERSVSALVALLVTFFALLAALARPWALWKAVVVATMIGCVAAAFLTPVGTRVFDLVVTPESIADGLLFGLIGVVVVEIAYRWSRRLH